LLAGARGSGGDDINPDAKLSAAVAAPLAWPAPGDAVPGVAAAGKLPRRMFAISRAASAIAASLIMVSAAEIPAGRRAAKMSARAGVNALPASPAGALAGDGALAMDGAGAADGVLAARAAGWAAALDAAAAAAEESGAEITPGGRRSRR